MIRVIDETMLHRSVADNLEELLVVLPPDIRARLNELPQTSDLLEVVLDLGRQPEARFREDFLYLREVPVTEDDIEYVVTRVGEFGADNRAGIPRTLHRISAIRNRRGRVIGLTCRVGRAIYGTIDIIRDILEEGLSILLLGPPGSGKTTKLRESARVLADELRKRVVIVDTSNEIAGDGDIPHDAIGHARRMQVPHPDRQHDVMIEAVENHMPEVIIIDEIGRAEEAYAARTIAERGVQLVATAHGNTLDNLLMNPTLSDLVGGVQAVTLSDEEARRRGTQKTVLERKAPPTFDVVVEMWERDKLAMHRPVADVVDDFLRGQSLTPEMRQRREDGTVETTQRAAPTPADSPPPKGRAKEARRGVRLYPYGVSRNRLQRAIKQLGLSLTISRTLEESDAILTLSAHYRRDTPRLRQAVEQNMPIYVVRSNTYAQIASRLNEIFADGKNSSTDTDIALREAEDAALQVLKFDEPIDLNPQSATIRKMQHQLIERYNLRSTSVGKEPHRRVRVMPT
jgi:stage III sporulation protein SpoIIIAA